MTPEQFCYWLQGFLELTSVSQVTNEQLESVKSHLETVFNKVTPKYAPRQPTPEEILRLQQ